MTTSGKNIVYTLPPCEFREFDKFAKWLSPDPTRYPEILNIPETVFVKVEKKFCAAEFNKCVRLPAGVNPVAHICIFADTKFRLAVNGAFVGVGPIAAGGDYDNRRPMPRQYYNRYEIPLGSDILDIFAEVQTPGEVQTDYSCGRCGFIFSCEVTFDDREPLVIVSDESWQVRVNHRRKSVSESDLTLALPEWEGAYVIPADESVWNLAFADIPMPEEEIILPVSIKSELYGGLKLLRADFTRIYSAYIMIKVINTDSEPLKLDIYAAEYNCNPNGNPCETLTVPSGENSYRGFRMRSIGEILVTFECKSEPEIEISLAYTHYPYDRGNLSNFICSDKMLNKIYSLGRDTLEICRQTLHLDSPLHQETLGCTGDYAIESLMTHMTYGDMRLTRLDLIRTADYLLMSGGVMFHTSYSLIWVSMLYDYYLYTADTELVRELLPALNILLDRFSGYLEDGVIMNPPNYMFIDWGTLDGFSMHHPPAALGQTSLNAFYRQALTDAGKLYLSVGEDRRAGDCVKSAESHRKACLEHFYDNKRRMFFDGISAPQCMYEPNRWLPENPSRRYYTRHSNTLAVFSGLIDGEPARELMERVVTEESLDGETYFDIQPYFMHYVMESIRKTGLFRSHGLRLLHLWDKQVNDSPKGMKEGWNAFKGDCSHAWGATPTYQLPDAFSGFEMLKPGFAEFRLSPELYGLDHAEISIPTPWGLIEIVNKKGETPIIGVPHVFKAVGGGIYSLTLQ